MKKIPIVLSNENYFKLQRFIKTGKRTGKELERAYVLMALHKNRRYKEIEDYYYVNRSTVWRIASNYQKHGLNSTLKDKSRSGQPKKYNEKQEAEVIALACSDSPKGNKRWTIRLLTEHLQNKKELETINRETVRLILKKTNINLG